MDAVSGEKLTRAGLGGGRDAGRQLRALIRSDQIEFIYIHRRWAREYKRINVFYGVFVVEQ